jgi:early secretory antigenic target protein ESAT-6
MSHVVEVVTGDLESAAAEVLASAGRLEGLVGDLVGYLNPMAATWTGSAAEQYSGVQARWNECAATIVEMQRTLGEGLDVIASNYDDTEQANSDMWSS